MAKKKPAVIIAGLAFAVMVVGFGYNMLSWRDPEGMGIQSTSI